MTDLDDVADPQIAVAISESTVAHDPSDAAPTRLRRRRVDKGLLIASLVIAAGLTLVVWGFFTATTGDEGVDRPAEIESISPVENAVQVLQQEGIVVDLEFGYSAVLIIDGIELETTDISQIVTDPGELRTIPPTATYDPGNAVISFVPSDGAVITEFSQGRHQARVVYWKLEDGRENALAYNWSFVVV